MMSFNYFDYEIYLDSLKKYIYTYALTIKAILSSLQN